MSRYCEESFGADSASAGQTVPRASMCRQVVRGDFALWSLRGRSFESKWFGKRRCHAAQIL